MDSRNLSLFSGHRTFISLISLTGIHVCGRSTGAPLLFLLSPPPSPPSTLPHTTYRGTGRHPSLLIFPWRRMEKLNLCAHTRAFIQNILMVGIKIPLSQIHKTFKVFEKMTLGVKMQVEKNWLVLLLVLGQMKR